MLSAEAVSDTARSWRLSWNHRTMCMRSGGAFEETTVAKTMMTVRGGPASGVKDVRASLARADLGGALNTRELMDIARVRNARALCVGTLRTIPWARPR